MALLRRVLGETLRSRRLRQRRTLREVSGAARVSLGYLSEIERGQKEASSELLAAICEALDVRLSELLREVSETMGRTETPMRRVPAAPRREPAGVGPRPTAPRPRMTGPREDMVSAEPGWHPDQGWESTGADDLADTPLAGRPRGDSGLETPPVETAEVAEGPLEPIGTEQAMLDIPDSRCPAPGDQQVGSQTSSVLFDGDVVSLPARQPVVAAA